MSPLPLGEGQGEGWPIPFPLQISAIQPLLLLPIPILTPQGGPPMRAALFLFAGGFFRGGDDPLIAFRSSINNISCATGSASASVCHWLCQCFVEARTGKASGTLRGSSGCFSFLHHIRSRYRICRIACWPRLARSLATGGNRQEPPGTSARAKHFPLHCYSDGQ